MEALKIAFNEITNLKPLPIDKSKWFFISTSHNKDYPSKYHIMDNDGNNLCGLKAYWIESTLQYLNSDGIIEGLEHLPTGYLFTNGLGCKKCIKKFKELKNEKTQS